MFRNDSSVMSANSFLERTLLFTFCIHGIAMLAMVFFLLPGLPGGPNESAARMAYVASGPGSLWEMRLHSVSLWLM
jgi:hypothetical protein